MKNGVLAQILKFSFFFRILFLKSGETQIHLGTIISCFQIRAFYGGYNPADGMR